MKGRELYETNMNFKRYVDLYCVKHELVPEQAFEHAIVRYYAEYLEKSAEGKIVTTTQITGGC